MKPQGNRHRAGAITYFIWACQLLRRCRAIPAFAFAIGQKERWQKTSVGADAPASLCLLSLTLNVRYVFVRNVIFLMSNQQLEEGVATHYLEIRIFLFHHEISKCRPYGRLHQTE